MIEKRRVIYSLTQIHHITIQTKRQVCVPHVLLKKNNETHDANFSVYIILKHTKHLKREFPDFREGNNLYSLFRDNHKLFMNP